MKHFKYVCRSGCGYITTVDKFYKRQRPFCGICGTRSTMEFLEEVELVGTLNNRLDIAVKKVT
ncbi:hypothetical protein C6399_07620 [Bacillus licheniformis]|nr:hypothetical protein C6399_07620 [Bacillus licheniformis]